LLPGSDDGGFPHVSGIRARVGFKFGFHVRKCRCSTRSEPVSLPSLKTSSSFVSRYTDAPPALITSIVILENVVDSKKPHVFRRYIHEIC
jgi:hypothetical protein